MSQAAQVPSSASLPVVWHLLQLDKWTAVFGAFHEEAHPLMAHAGFSGPLKAAQLILSCTPSLSFHPALATCALGMVVF